MKIIFASKFYYRRGGLEAYLFKTQKLLESYGHEVIPFSTNYQQNYETKYSEYCCSYHDLSRMGISGNFLTNFEATINMFFNKEAYINMKKLIEKTKPDLVQGFGVTKHLSYSIFKAAKEMGIPTIMRLSDYAILCPNSSAVDGRGEICSDFACSKSDFKKAVMRKCIHDSALASIIGKSEVKINIALEVYKKYVDYFIAPSRFIRNIFMEHLKISPQRISYLPIFIDAVNCSSECNNDYFLYAGRLSNEKGVKTLLKAFSINKGNKIVIAGTGPEEINLKRYAQEQCVNAEFIGFQNFEKLQVLISNCKAVIIPSEWYENSPNIILEAYACGKPVIGSCIGGIPELIENYKTGLLFEMGNAEDLAEKIRYILDDRSRTDEMGKNAKELVNTRFAEEEHYENLMNIYKPAMKKKVLLVNNYYYNRGGDCTYLFALKKILEDKGHNVVVFSMHHPKNIQSTWSKYFVNYINYDEEVKRINFKTGIKVATRTIYFFKAKRMITKLIKEERPNIAHLQNIHHHITPSIIYAFKKYNIPVVWTLHDYQLICPNISFLANCRICERCKIHKYYWPVIMRCKKGSFAASLMSSIEIMIHNIMGINRLIGKFIAPSDFLKNKFIEYGFKQNQLARIHHLIDIGPDYSNETQGDYIIFVGRLTEEKGVKTLINAVINVESCKLKIIGDGPLKEELIKYTKMEHVDNKIEFLGHRSRSEVITLVKNCKFLVIPSEWYEVAGLVIFEAYACGKPVIGSQIGGIPEFIRDKETGLTYEMGNADDLQTKIKFMLDNPEEIERMGNNARDFLLNELSADIHYEKLIEVYNEID